MNVIKTGELYRICGDGVEVGRTLPAGTYEVVFIKNQGFFLKLAKIKDSGGIRVYGRMTERIEKVLRSYAETDGNLGVILSGAKGIGKSLFAKLITARAVADGLPVIMVNQYEPGLPQFLASIEQRCLVLFDEFDKNFFDPSRDTEDHTAVQDAFLTLFDGVYVSSKLFVITANSLTKLSEFLVNRPGRFRYHIRFSYPDEEEIRAFLVDKLGADAEAEEIEAVVRFSAIVPLSYDCLTAIATELASGETFESCLEILNIVNVTGSHSYTGLLRFEGEEELRVGYIGYRNFFDRNEDSTAIRSEVSGFDGMKSVEYGHVFVRQVDVRRVGKFMQDGTVVIPYADGANFRWVLGRRVKGTGKYAKPTELVLTSDGANRQVSYRDLV